MSSMKPIFTAVSDAATAGIPNVARPPPSMEPAAITPDLCKKVRRLSPEPAVSADAPTLPALSGKTPLFPLSACSLFICSSTFPRAILPINGKSNPRPSARGGGGHVLIHASLQRLSLRCLDASIEHAIASRFPSPQGLNDIDVALVI